MICRKFICVSIFCILIGCYSFKGTSIPASTTSFYVSIFRNDSFNAPADVGQIFTQQLVDKILQETPLRFEDEDPHLLYEGAVTSYNVSSVAASNLDDGLVGSTLNRLEIQVFVECVDTNDDENSWTQNFSFFQDFDGAVNLNDIQSEFITQIFDQITEEVFKKSFTNW